MKKIKMNVLNRLVLIALFSLNTANNIEINADFSANVSEGSSQIIIDSDLKVLNE